MVCSRAESLASERRHRSERCRVQGLAVSAVFSFPDVANGGYAEVNSNAEMKWLNGEEAYGEVGEAERKWEGATSMLRRKSRCTRSGSCFVANASLVKILTR